MSYPDDRLIEPKGSAGVEMSGQMETIGQRCALCAMPIPIQRKFVIFFSSVNQAFRSLLLDGTDCNVQYRSTE